MHEVVKHRLFPDAQRISVEAFFQGVGSKSAERDGDGEQESGKSGKGHVSYYNTVRQRVTDPTQMGFEILSAGTADITFTLMRMSASEKST